MLFLHIDRFQAKWGNFRLTDDKSMGQLSSVEGSPIKDEITDNAVPFFSLDDTSEAKRERQRKRISLLRTTLSADKVHDTEDDQVFDLAGYKKWFWKYLKSKSGTTVQDMFDFDKIGSESDNILDAFKTEMTHGKAKRTKFRSRLSNLREEASYKTAERKKKRRCSVYSPPPTKSQLKGLGQFRKDIEGSLNEHVRKKYFDKGFKAMLKIIKIKTIHLDKFKVLMEAYRHIKNDEDAHTFVKLFDRLLYEVDQEKFSGPEIDEIKNVIMDIYNKKYIDEIHAEELLRQLLTFHMTSMQNFEIMSLILKLINKDFQLETQHVIFELLPFITSDDLDVRDDARELLSTFGDVKTDEDLREYLISIGMLYPTAPEDMSDIKDHILDVQYFNNRLDVVEQEAKIKKKLKKARTKVTSLKGLKQVTIHAETEVPIYTDESLDNLLLVDGASSTFLEGGEGSTADIHGRYGTADSMATSFTSGSSQQLRSYRIRKSGDVPHDASASLLDKKPSEAFDGVLSDKSQIKVSPRYPSSMDITEHIKKMSIFKEERKASADRTKKKDSIKEIRKTKRVSYRPPNPSEDLDSEIDFPADLNRIDSNTVVKRKKKSRKKTIFDMCLSNFELKDSAISIDEISPSFALTDSEQRLGTDLLRNASNSDFTG